MQAYFLLHLLLFVWHDYLPAPPRTQWCSACWFSPKCVYAGLCNYKRKCVGKIFIDVLCLLSHLIHIPSIYHMHQYIYSMVIIWTKTKRELWQQTLGTEAHIDVRYLWTCNFKTYTLIIINTLGYIWLLSSWHLSWWSGHPQNAPECADFRQTATVHGETVLDWTPVDAHKILIPKKGLRRIRDHVRKILGK